MFFSYNSFVLFKIKLLSSFVPFPLFYVNDVLNIVIYFPVLQDYYIFSFDFHIFLKAGQRKGTTKRKKGRSMIATDTPEKNIIEEKEQTKKKVCN
jgi:hypothetical protein